MPNLDNVSDVFANATVAGGNLTIPTTDLPRFSQGNDVAEGAEVVYALLSAMHTAVNAAGNANSSVNGSVSNTFSANALTMNRAFSFNTVLDISGNIDDFNVKLDSSNKSQALTMTVTPLGGGGDNILAAANTPSVIDKSDDSNDARVAELNVFIDGVKIAYDARYVFTFADSASADDAKWQVTGADGKFYFSSKDVAGLALEGSGRNVVVTIDDSNVVHAQQPSAATATVQVIIQV